MNRTIRLILACGTASLLAFPAQASDTAADTSFTILVSNVSTETTLRLPDGRTSRVPVAPGAFAIVAEGAAAFQAGQAANAGLESLAEDGNPDAFIEALGHVPGVRQAGRFLHDEPFEVSARQGDRLVFLAMFAQSNDLFYAPDPDGIALFDPAGSARAGEVMTSVVLWDAGTEVNEAPGAGPNQAPRQPAPGSGPAEGGVIRPVNDGFAYPTPTEVLEVAINPAARQ
jgi:hypothetical protein